MYVLGFFLGSLPRSGMAKFKISASNLDEPRVIGIPLAQRKEVLVDRQDRSCPEIGQLCWPNLWMDSDLLASPGGDWNLGFLHAAFPKSDSFVGRACGWIGGSVASPGGSMDLGLAHD